MPARLILSVLVGVVVLAAVTAAAASLGGLSTDQLAAGSTSVGSCDTDGVTLSYTTSGAKVTDVTVSDIADPACEGGSLWVTLVDSVDADIGSGGPVTVPSDGDTSPNQVAVSISPQPDAGLVTGTHVAILGP